ncbi:MAG: NHL repeat-containing protein, partial [Pyrinomonadaceae bacterium]
NDRRPPVRRKRLGWLFFSALILSFGGVALFLFIMLREEKPRPTVAGWRAMALTLAGDGSPAFRDAGAGTPAGFAEPFGLAVGRDGSVFVADAGESNRIRKITPQGTVETFAGGAEGYMDGPGAAASFHTPSGLAIDLDGNLYVADTGNNRIRKVSPEGVVTTLAGDGTAGDRDGEASLAQFNGPVGVASDKDGNVYVADTYNDRIRMVSKDGQVRTVAGAGTPGYADGDALTAALFDTPCAVVAAGNGELFIADTGNHRLRKLTKEGQVVTLPLVWPDGAAAGEISRPLGLALTHDDFLYVTESGRARVTQIAPDGTARVLAGHGPGFADGDGPTNARFNQPTGITVARDGALFVADSANYIVRQLVPADQQTGPLPRLNDSGVLPRIALENYNGNSFPWPLDPQWRRHEVVATLGEVRGSFDSDDSRHHLHSGIDVFGVYGQTVRVVREEKISQPLSNWGFGGLNEGLRVGLISYIHLRVGRDEQDQMLDEAIFLPVRNADGSVARVRIKRGTRVRVGDALGTVNRMYHVHMNLGPPGAEANPLTLPLAGFSDGVAPRIERDGIKLFDEAGAPLTEKRRGRLVVAGRVRVVLDAYDQVDGNQPRRRLGLYRAGFQILSADGSPAPGFAGPRITIEFNRLPPDSDATKIAYADESGITVYGSASTRFLYELTNTVRDGRAERGWWDTSELPEGDYILRVIAADYAGNEATTGRDLSIAVERN